ncbi:MULTISPECIES: TonB-dependent receptor [unclassified Aeromonas]|uniref:TonB-dependent receptor n=1 Tax=unclassified Aeromonas TaxID=257493 RepID=UPI0022E64C8C|nr:MULTISPECIES: TonB-dependent siderophore receptor [unclassified Aeromonas]
MVVIRSPSPQLVPFKLHRFGQQRQTLTVVGKRSQHEEVATATRTNTPAKLVPQSIDSVKASELTAFGQPTLSEALTGIPGVNASGDTRFDGVTIRGFSASNDFYLDGFRDDMQYTRDLGNIERVEVLKGPAAVLYGRGSTGGIVNRVSKVPQKGQASSVSAQVGSFDSRRFAADLNGEAGERVQVRLNLAQEDKESFRDDVTSKRTLLAPSVNWEITDTLNWLVQYERNEHDRTPDRGIPGVDGRPADVPIESVYSDTRRDFIDDVAQSTRSRFTWDINDQWQLRQQLGYTTLDSQFDNTYVTSVKGDKVTRARWQQDLKASSLTSNTEAEGQLQTGPIAHRLLVGLEQDWQDRTPKLYQNASPIPAGNLYDPGSLPTYDGAMKLSSDAHHRVRGVGLYVQDQLSLGDWHLLAGLRRDDFTVTSRRNDLDKEETLSVTSLSPRLGLVWNPIEEHAFYTSYSKTFTPVGGELIGITPGDKNNNLDPQHTRLYEGGVKSDWLNGRLATTLSLYRLEMYNKRSKDPLDPTKVILTGLQRTDGIELSARAQLTDEIYLRGGVAIQDAEQVKADADLQGKRPMNVSRQNGQLFAGYQSGKQGWFGETGVTAVGDRFADNANTTTLPGYARFDARAGYRWPQWEAQLSVENLTDHDYFVSATSAAQIMPGTPRQLHLTAAYRF